MTDGLDPLAPLVLLAQQARHREDGVERGLDVVARDALHLAVMERHGISSILSFDADFDRWPGLQRLYKV